MGMVRERIKTEIHKMEKNQINWFRFFYLQTHSAVKLFHSSRACDSFFLFSLENNWHWFHPIAYSIFLNRVFVEEIKWLHAFRNSFLSESEFDFEFELWIRYRCTNSCMILYHILTHWALGLRKYAMCIVHPCSHSIPSLSLSLPSALVMAVYLVAQNLWLITIACMKAHNGFILAMLHNIEWKQWRDELVFLIEIPASSNTCIHAYNQRMQSKHSLFQFDFEF